MFNYVFTFVFYYIAKLLSVLQEEKPLSSGFLERIVYDGGNLLNVNWALAGMVWYGIR